MTDPLETKLPTVCYFRQKRIELLKIMAAQIAYKMVADFEMPHIQLLCRARNIKLDKQLLEHVLRNEIFIIESCNLALATKEELLDIIHSICCETYFEKTSPETRFIWKLKREHLKDRTIRKSAVHAIALLIVQHRIPYRITQDWKLEIINQR